MREECANCGKTIEDQDNIVFEDGFPLCNTLCRYEWRRKGKPTPGNQNSENKESLFLSEKDFEFDISNENLKGEKLILKTSSWKGSRLFHGNTLLKPNKRKLFSTTKEYTLNNDYSNITIKLHYKFLDAIPQVEVNGEKIAIARSLSFWEYIWICIPAILLFLGGAIGGGIGAMAVYSNSIIIRRIKPIIPRYLFTGAANILAFILFFRIILLINPTVENLSLKAAYKNTNSRYENILTSGVWTCKKITDSNGKDYLGSSNPMLNSKRYFKGDGSYSQVFPDGSKVIGSWEMDTTKMTLSLIINNKQYAAKIEKLDKNELILDTNGILVINQKDE